jgi:hypothetical protein
MVRVTRRPYAGRADLRTMIDLLVAARPAERLADFPSRADLRELLGTSTVRDNARLWQDAAGQLVGFSLLLSTYGSFFFEIAPRADGDDIARQMITWAAGRVRHASGAPDEPTRLRTGCREENAARIALVERKSDLLCTARAVPLVTFSGVC